MADAIQFPHTVYKGTPNKDNADKGTATDPVENKVVADQDALDLAVKEGWRLHYSSAPAKAAPAHVAAKADDDDDKKAGRGGR